MKKTKQGLLIEGKQSVLKLSVLSESIIRVQRQMDNQNAPEELILTNPLPEYEDWSVKETPDFITVETPAIRAVYSRADSTLQFCDCAFGKIIFLV